MKTIVLDNFVSNEFLYTVNNFFDDVTWNFNNQANKNAFGVGEHRFFGAGFYPHFWKEQLEKNGWMAYLWKAIELHLNIKGVIHNIHANLQVLGQDGSWHIDEYGPDCRALIYYPVMQWKNEWGGTLDIKETDTEEYVSYDYIPGRIIYMDGTKSHRANAPLIKNKGRISLVYNIIKE